MELRSQKAACLALTAALWIATAAAAQQDYEFDVRHDHWWKSRPGKLRIHAQGISFAEKGEKSQHAWDWTWQDIQQLKLQPDKLTVLTYQDSKWRAGVDREYEFLAPADRRFTEAYRLLSARLDQRLVAAVPDEQVTPLWQVHAKLHGRLRGSQGVLIVGEDRIVFQSDEKGASRTWRYADIDNVSSSGPFQLTLTTYERSKFDYGNRKGFQFQLKQALDEERYNDLWRRINRSKGLKIITSIYEKEKTQ